MKIMVLSDIHGNFKAAYKLSREALKLKPDLLVICGDITHFGSLNEAEKILSVFKGFQTFFVPGNCDPPSLLTVRNIYEALNIHGKLHTSGSTAFLGIGGSPKTPFTTQIEFEEEEIYQIVREALNDFRGRLIVVSHSPPANTSTDLTSLGLHAGSRALRAFIEEYKPLSVLHGHIHEARGLDRLGGTLIVNPGPARQNFYAILELNVSTEAFLKSANST
ncbi:metallophosphoesterase [Candidatus Bathyarchaeota archaeon]|nr:metallophosphoesterase [Candidatus Bathyarchaeota archaeon]MBS7613506.1 metallophosphoesterase [Candidatus Bathyarchaeota archaeon]MBS7617711.1 metallophosphoesterase [Candidatus Bathyarchaeota archaeon]